MTIVDILSADRVLVQAGVSSKKKLLEQMSDLLAAGSTAVTANDVFISLVNREKLGSTAMPGGVAIPHGRMRGLDQAVGALVKLDEGVEYDDSDGEPVELIFGLIVPQDADQEALDILKSVAELLSDADAVEAMRHADSAEALHGVVASRQA